MTHEALLEVIRAAIEGEREACAMQGDALAAAAQRVADAHQGTVGASAAARAEAYRALARQIRARGNVRMP